MPVDTHPNVDPGFDYNVGIAALDAPAQLMVNGARGHPRPLQQATIAKVLASEDFKQSLERPALNWVVSAVPDADWVPPEFRPKVPFVELSAGDVSKIAGKHLGRGGLRADDFAFIPEWIDTAELVVLERANPQAGKSRDSLKLFSSTSFGQNRWAELVLVATPGRGLYLKSLRVTDGNDAYKTATREAYRANRRATILYQAEAGLAALIALFEGR